MTLSDVFYAFGAIAAVFVIYMVVIHAIQWMWELGDGRVRPVKEEVMDEDSRQAPPAFAKVVIRLGTDGDAYYTAVYCNGEPGPRSEGYQGPTAAEALANAVEAAQRDFPDVPVEVDATP